MVLIPRTQEGAAAPKVIHLNSNLIAIYEIDHEIRSQNVSADFENGTGLWHHGL